MAKQYDIMSRFSPLHGEDPEDELHDEDVDLDNPLVKAGKKQIDKEEGSDELDIDTKFEVEEEEEEPEADDEDQDEQDDDGESEQEPDEEEDNSYSNRVKKRIAREKARADRLQAQLSETESRVGRLESRWEAEADEKKLAEQKQKAETKLAELRQAKVDAKEEGDTAKEVEIEEQMLDIKAELRSAESKAADARRRLDESKSTGEIIDGIDLGKLPPQARKWVDAHPEFKTDQKFRRAVLATDSYLTSAGHNHQSEQYWKKLEGLISEDFPKYFKKQPKVTTRRKPSTATAGSINSTSERTDRKRGRVKITADDKANMIRFGLDPNDRNHLREFAAAKLTS